MLDLSSFVFLFHYQVGCDQIGRLAALSYNPSDSDRISFTLASVRLHVPTFCIRAGMSELMCADIFYLGEGHIRYYHFLFDIFSPYTVLMNNMNQLKCQH